MAQPVQRWQGVGRPPNRRDQIPILWCCLHAGLGSARFEVIWNPDYRVPSAANDDVCDYPLRPNLAVMTAALTAECAL